MFLFCFRYIVRKIIDFLFVTEIQAAHFFFVRSSAIILTLLVHYMITTVAVL